MTEERATYETTPPARQVKAVRLENFTGDTDWQGPVLQRLFARFPSARAIGRKPQVLLVALRDGRDWTADDEAFFAEMRASGYFQRWETLTELPPVPRAVRSTYEDIGYRVGTGMALSSRQANVLLSLCHDYEARSDHWEKQAERFEAQAADFAERSASLATDWNALVDVLSSELRVHIYSGGGSNDWIAEDTTTGRVLCRDASMIEIYRKALRVRLEGGKA